MTNTAPTLHGRTALITGSTSGIGRAIAEAFAECACGIVLNGFGDPAEIERMRAEMAARSSGRVSYFSCDVALPGEIRSMIAGAIDLHGRLDILVNNAGVQFTAGIADFPDDQWDRIIAINLSSAFHAIKAAEPSMRANRWGRIVNIASAHGLVASPRKCAYVAAKHGLIGLTRAVSLETANTGVTVNAICPGWVRTPLVEDQIRSRAATDGISIDDAAQALLREKQPMLTFTTPEQVAALALFLCGDSARTITGAAFAMDGGWTAQ